LLEALQTLEKLSAKYHKTSACIFSVSVITLVAKAWQMLGFESMDSYRA